MTKKRMGYDAPTVKTLVVRFEGVILSTSEKRYYTGGGGNYTDSETIDNGEY